ncbi:CLUMA_CG000872, isoform A [Clunio marinus]|uniref:CLUMA_CG000872, isoform A n=1 Tax=Clunio marinus TaxID=568069 RepID=A0A1J1HLH7_9DIPT|nr:CLUMA_CG000872, isoform A [Clunio marinus]
MKFAVVTFVLFVALTGAHCAPKYFDFNGMKGMVDAHSIINGIPKSEANSEAASKAEEVIKAMIHKHLASKKQSKIPAKQVKEVKEKAPVEETPIEEVPVEEVPVEEAIVEAPQPGVAEKPVSLESLADLTVNWDDHPETRDAINEKIPGGIESVENLINLLKERKLNKT